MAQPPDILSVQKNRRRGGKILLALGIILVGFGYATFQKDHSLPYGVNAVPGTKNVTALTGPIWASDHEVFTGTLAGPLVDTRTGIAVPIGGFGGGGFYTGLVQVSPDGKRVLWANISKDTPQWNVTSLRETKEWHSQRFEANLYAASVTWLPDSRHWVEPTKRQGKMSAMLHSLDNPTIKQFSLPISATYLKIVGFTPEGDALAIEGTGQRGRGTPNVNLIQFPLKENSSVVRTIAVAPHWTYSEPVQEYEFVLSPDGTKLAWLLISDNPPSGIGALMVLLTRRQSNVNSTVSSVWITDVDGSHPRRILMNIHPPYPPVNLNWETDGKHLSFYCNNFLYAFSAN